MKKVIIFQLEMETWEILRKKAFDERISVSELVRRAVRDSLQNKRPGTSK